MTDKIVPVRGEVEFDTLKIMNNGSGMAHGMSAVFYRNNVEIMRLPITGARLKGMSCIEVNNLRAYLPYTIQ